jgi:hypothetical protein
MTYDTSANQRGALPSEETFTFHRIGTNGYPYVTDNVYLPLGALVTSIVVVALPTDNAVINKIRVHIGSWSGDVTIPNNTYVKNELIGAAQFGVAIPLANDVENKLSAEYLLDEATAANPSPAYIVIKYRAFRGLMEKPASAVATMIGP